MSVPEQVPYKEYRATGSNNSFEITFYLPDPKDLVVMVNKEIPLVGAYSIVGDSVVFSTPPNEGDLVELTRDTQLDRETNFKSYDNSFRPETINFDLDKIWLVLQESNLVDAKILARLKQEIEWRRTHDFNYDELAQVREKQLFDALKGYTDTLNAATNPGVFQGVIAGVVFAQDGKSIQTHLEEILEALAQERENIDSKADGQYVDDQLGLKADQATTYSKNEVDSALDQKASKVDIYTKPEVDTALSAVAAGHKAYTTLALAQAAQGTLPANTIVEVTNDPTASNNGTYQWNGTTLTKSAYDPLTQAKADSSTKANAAEANAISKIAFEDIAEKKGNLHFSAGFVAGNLKTDGTLEASSSRSCTDGFVLINPASQYSVDSASYASLFSLAFYDKNKTFISYVTKESWGVETPLVMPDNAMFARFCVANTGISTFKIKVLTRATIAASSSELSAKQYAETKASEAEVNAKQYADNIPLLDTRIYSSNDKAEKLIGIIAGLQYVSAELSLPIISTTDKTKHSYLVAVKPNTTYTLAVSIALGSVDIRNFKTKPDVQSRNLADSGVTQSLTYVAATQRYTTFTTDANTNYIVIDPKNYTGFEFVIAEGVYSATIWNAFNKKSFDKTLTANILNAKQINSESFIKSKNLFEGYTYGMNVSPALDLGVESSVPLSAANSNSTNFKQYVGAFIPCAANTTYTISKQPSDEFVIVLNKANRSTGTVIFRDASAQEVTFTTGSADEFIFVLLSRNYEQPLIQVEVGSVATEYESPGLKFDKAALPLGKKLNEPVINITDNGYISLGTQTDKYQLKSNVRTSATVLDNFFDPLVADFPHLVTKNLLGQDYTGNHNIYEYVFEPDHYEQKIVLTAGMHPFEAVPPFALGMFLDEIYRNPEKHEGLAYLRNKVKIVVIPIVNAWAMDTNPKGNPSQSLTANSVNPSRNFPERWDVLRWDIVHDNKGSAPLSEPETQYMYNVLKREKDGLSFYLDLHTAQGFTEDTIIYWQEDDPFLKPILQNIVSMRNDIVRSTLGREPVNQAFETQRATSTYHPWRVWGIPSGTVEYPTQDTVNLSSVQTTYYTDLLFNCVWYALKAQLLEKRKQAKLNEDNKQYISLYGHLTAYNDVLNQKWSYSQWQTNCYDKLGLTKSVIGAASGSYELVKYIHAPAGYKNTVVLSAGKRGLDEKKSVTELGFFAHKLMTDSNPHIVALRNNTRFIFLPVLNPHGHDNNSLNNANSVQPYNNFATSTQPESVALRSFIDSETIDLFVDISSLTNANKPAGYADCQVIHNAKADAEYQSVFGILKEKYAVAINSNVANYSTSLIKSQIADYINGKGIAYSNHFFAQNVLPLRTTGETSVTYVDYGYEANELAYCTEVLLNNIKEICQRRTLSKYLAN